MNMSKNKRFTKDEIDVLSKSPYEKTFEKTGLPLPMNLDAFFMMNGSKIHQSLK